MVSTPGTLSPLPWRKAAALELERLSELHTRCDDRQAEARLLRDRLVRLRTELQCESLTEAIDHLDSAALLIGDARRHLEPIPEGVT